MVHHYGLLLTFDLVKNRTEAYLMCVYTLIIICLSIKYWWKLNKNCLDGCDSLAVHALLDNRRICNTGISSWSTGLKNVFTLVDGLEIWDKPNILNASSFNGSLLSSLQSNYDNLWIHQINCCQAKLRTYCLFKKEFAPENYILMFKRSITANFSRLRVSAHSLMIEKGRHFWKKIPIENRLCTLCNLNETEDEAHFMLRCTNYSNIREKMFSDISDIYADFDNLDDNDKFVLLIIMGVKDYDCILPIINFVNSAFKQRTNVDI